MSIIGHHYWSLARMPLTTITVPLLTWEMGFVFKPSVVMSSSKMGFRIFAVRSMNKTLKQTQ